MKNRWKAISICKGWWADRHKGNPARWLKVLMRTPHQNSLDECSFDDHLASVPGGVAFPIATGQSCQKVYNWKQKSFSPAVSQSVRGISHRRNAKKNCSKFSENDSYFYDFFRAAPAHAQSVFLRFASMRKYHGTSCRRKSPMKNVKRSKLVCHPKKTHIITMTSLVRLPLTREARFTVSPPWESIEKVKRSKLTLVIPR